MSHIRRFPGTLWFLATALTLAVMPFARADDSSSFWPAITREQRPWAFWWWMGSAVDKTNLTRELTRYHDAGMGGVHIIPIYGARGWESNYIPYLSPRWMEMLAYTVSEADRLDLGIDMTTGTGWCFGGPKVTAQEANARVIVKQSHVASGIESTEKFDAATLQALMAFGPDGTKMDVLGRLRPDGTLDWKAPGDSWTLFAVSQRPSGQKVKRAAPGDEGYMLNPFYPEAMRSYLRWFDEAFANYKGPKPRAQFQDSYEYRSDWSPDFFAQFQKRRGYRLQGELPALFGTAEGERAGRVKYDYRRTISDLMVEGTMPLWVQWSHQHGFRVRYQAHGAPANLLDLYALADSPETEMFHLDRDRLVSKFASSAAHVAGHPLASSETGTWLKEHFTETLADMKYLVDDLFLSGINSIVYHGVCYSPDEAPWPGWVFYASFEVNPRNSVWHDVSALNAYISRCQSLLQSGRPGNDILLYWPIADRWSDPNGLVQEFTVHGRDWLEGQPIGQTARWLWERGYQFDYISDRQLAAARAANGEIAVPGGRYRAVVVPPCQFMPLETLSNLVGLAQSGATIIFDQHLPNDVPGLADLEHQRSQFKELIRRAAELSAKQPAGAIRVGALDASLAAAGVARESMLDQAGLMCVRRAVDGGYLYFIANRGDNIIDDWVPLPRPVAAVEILDPLTGKTGAASVRADGGQARVFLQLAPGQSLLLRARTEGKAGESDWAYWTKTGSSIELTGTWRVQFVSGGPELPAPYEAQRLESWTRAGDTNAQRFAGTALYTLRFDRPDPPGARWELDLGGVRQSARLRLNGRDLGVLFTPPFRVELPELQPSGNRLEVEVSNVSANRIRDLDQRGVKWKNFRDINFVNVDYRPFDASRWPLTDSGLLGPVTLSAIAPLSPKDR